MDESNPCPTVQKTVTESRISPDQLSLLVADCEKDPGLVRSERNPVTATDWSIQTKSWTWIGSIHGLDWTGRDDCDTVFNWQLV